MDQPLSQTIKDFLTAYILGIIGLFVLSWLLKTFMAIELPGGIGVVPFVLGVQYAAQKHVSRGGGPVGGKAAWRTAVAMTLAAIVVSVVLAGILMAVLGGEAVFGPEFMQILQSQIFLTVFAIVFVFYVLMARLGWGWMVKSGLKAAERRKK